MKKVKVSHRLQIIIGVAVSLCLMLIGVTSYALLRTSTYTPADLLPADATVAFLSNADVSLTSSIERFVPLVRRVPLDGERADIAVVRLPNGEEAWIRFAPSKIPGGAPDISASDQRALAMLSTEHKGLSQLADFRSLASTYALGNTWMYLSNARRDASFFLPVALPDRPVSVSFSNNDARIAWISTDDTLHTVAGLPQINTDILIHAGNMLDAWTYVHTSLPEQQRTAYEAILRQKVLAHFGSDISAAYDLLPLLDGPGTFLADDGGMLLEGTAKNDPTPIMEKLHDGFRSTATSATRITQTFDETFDIDTMQAETDSLQEETTDQNGWTMRTTADTTSGRSLVTTVRGNRFMISTRPELFRSITDQSIEAGNIGLQTVAAGSLEQGATQNLLGPSLPGEAWMNMLPSGSGGTLRWELMQNRNLKILRLY